MPKVRFKGLNDISEHFPFRRTVGPYVQDRYGLTHAFIRLDAPANDVASSDRMVALQQSIVTLLEALPEEIWQMQFHYSNSGDYRREIADHGRFGGGGDVVDMLRKTRVLRLGVASDQRDLVRPELMLVISCLPDVGGAVGRALISSKSGTVSLQERTPNEKETREADAALRLSISIMADVFSRVGIDCRQMDVEGVVEHLYQLWNPALAALVPVNYTYGLTPFNDGWLTQNWSLKRDHWVIGAGAQTRYHGLVSLNVQPEGGSTPGIVDRLTLASGIRDLRVTTSIRRIDKNTQTEQLRFALSRTVKSMEESLSLYDRVFEPNKRVDPSLQRYNIEASTRADEARKLLEDIQTGREFQVNCQLVAHTWADSLEKLNHNRSILLARFAEINGARGVCETEPTYYVTRASLPGSVEPMPRNLKVRSRMAADLTPLTAGFTGVDTPLCVFRSSSGGLIPINLFDSPSTTAPLVFVSGASGKGKSFLINQLILQHMIDDALLVILDVGGSYRPIVELLGGKMISLDLSRPFCFNPLQVYSTGSGGEFRIPSPAERSRTVATLEALLVQPDDAGGMVPIELRNEVDAALEFCFHQAAARNAPFITLSNLFKRLSSLAGVGQELASRLKPFTKGQEYGEWFDGPTTVDFRSRVVCFDLKGIRSDKRLCAAMTPVIVNYVYDLVMRNRGCKKIVIQDEMWEFVANERMLDFITEAWKTFRKEDAVTIGCTQSLASDIADSVVGTAVVSNTDTYFLLPQGGAIENTRVSAMLDLTDGQRDILENLRSGVEVDADGEVYGWRSALLIRGRGPSTGRSGEIIIRATPEEYWTATTAPVEIDMRNRYTRANGGDVLPAIEQLAREYPGGYVAAKRLKDQKIRKLPES